MLDIHIKQLIILAIITFNTVAAVKMRNSMPVIPFADSARKFPPMR